MNRRFISYPKSGRSWLRYVFSQIGVEPQLSFQHDSFEFNSGAKPALDFSLEKRRLRMKPDDKIVYLKRDPRDIMVSLFFQVTGRFKDFFLYDGSFSDFIRDDYFGAKNLREFRQMWESLAAEFPILVVHYEACHQDLENVVRTIMDYYQFPIDDAKLTHAVREAQFDRMKLVEESGTFEKPWLNLRNNSPKVREGKIGGYHAFASASDVQFLNLIFGLEPDLLPKS